MKSADPAILFLLFVLLACLSEGTSAFHHKRKQLGKKSHRTEEAKERQLSLFPVVNNMIQSSSEIYPQDEGPIPRFKEKDSNPSEEKLSLFSEVNNMIESASSIKANFLGEAEETPDMRFKEALRQAPPATIINENNQKVFLDFEAELGPGPIYKKGWMKFLSFGPTEKKTLSQFYLNEAFDEQKKRKYNTSQSDEYGPVDIPNREQFFFTLSKDSLYITSARRNDLVKTVEVVNIVSLYPQIPTNSFVGGVEDQGNYKEGFCFKLREKGSYGDKIFIICADSLTVKQEWMNFIAKVKIRQQGNIALSQNQNPISGVAIEATLGSGFGNEAFSTQYTEIGPNGKPINPDLLSLDKGPRDGRWIIMQEWSSCTVACGGGSQTQQRYCVPPMNGGKPCFGAALLSRPCNTHACPVIPAVETQEVLPTKVKMMPVSRRPQRYETCIINEGDLDVIREDLVQFQRKPRIPARVVLNNRTLTVFESDHYDAVMFSVVLKDIDEINDHADDPASCFVVQDVKTLKKISLCAMASSIESASKVKTDWIKKIVFFRDKCHEALPSAEDDPILDMKRKELEEETLERKAALEDTSKHHMEKMQKSLEEVQQMAMMALSKEMKYEEMMANELMQKEKNERKNLEKRLEEERQKMLCLKRELKKKALRYEDNNKDKEIQDKIASMKNDIKDIILKKREEQSQKLLTLKKLSDRKNRDILNQIQQLRSQMAGDMLSAQKEGNMTACFTSSSEAREDYCSKGYSDDPTKMQDCKEPSNFCYVCCETEFGEFHYEKREVCMDKCELTPKNKGSWVWVPSANRVK